MTQHTDHETLANADTVVTRRPNPSAEGAKAKATAIADLLAQAMAEVNAMAQAREEWESVFASSSETF